MAAAGDARVQLEQLSELAGLLLLRNFPIESNYSKIEQARRTVNSVPGRQPEQLNESSGCLGR